MSNDNQSDGKTKHITFWFVVAWILGVLFGVAGISLLFQHQVATGFFMILAALVALPPVNTFVKNKTNFSISGGLRTAAFLVLVAISGVVSSQTPGSTTATVVSTTSGTTTVQA